MQQNTYYPYKIDDSTIEFYTRRARKERSRMAFRMLDAIFRNHTRN